MIFNLELRGFLIRKETTLDGLKGSIFKPIDGLKSQYKNLEEFMFI